jgi:hypothetical protein
LLDDMMPQSRLAAPCRHGTSSCIRSICPHPERPGEMPVGIRCGGAWLGEERAQSGVERVGGMRATCMPPEQAGNPGVQDPHRIQRCAAAADVH